MGGDEVTKSWRLRKRRAVKKKKKNKEVTCLFVCFLKKKCNSGHFWFADLVCLRIVERGKVESVKEDLICLILLRSARDSK